MNLKRVSSTVTSWRFNMSVEEQKEKLERMCIKCMEKNHYMKICHNCIKNKLAISLEKNRELEKEIAWFKSHKIKVDEYNSVTLQEE
jgi:NADH:ubiquinone oxidoreductase subunit D